MCLLGRNRDRGRSKRDMQGTAEHCPLSSNVRSGTRSRSQLSTLHCYNIHRHHDTMARVRVLAGFHIIKENHFIFFCLSFYQNIIMPRPPVDRYLSHPTHAVAIKRDLLINVFFFFFFTSSHDWSRASFLDGHVLRGKRTNQFHQSATRG